MRVEICLGLLMSVLWAGNSYADDRAAGPAESANPNRSTVELPIEATVAALAERHGENEADRIRAGVGRVAREWRDADGSGDEFVGFCQDFYVADPADRKRLLTRLETVMTTTQGHLMEVCAPSAGGPTWPGTRCRALTNCWRRLIRPPIWPSNFMRSASRS